MRDVLDGDEKLGVDWDHDLPEREALRKLNAEREALDLREAALVDAARRLAIPWRSIATDLGVSATTAHRRHSHHDPVAARRRELRAEQAREREP